VGRARRRSKTQRLLWRGPKKSVAGIDQSKSLKCRLAARGAVCNGVPPYDLWEHPPALEKIPPHGSDSGSYLVGEVFGARSVILIKDVDGVYIADPKLEPGAIFIPEIKARN
jgi:hypothetical protein